jgi:hypothetical protein
MHSHLKKIYEFAGVLTKDWLRYQLSFIARDNSYLQLVNRLERISAGPENQGFVCLWPYTSRLHAPLHIPELGKELMKKCLAKTSFQLMEDRELDLDIQISVLIGHRGIERLPLLLATIKSIASQVGVGLECIVIEQDNETRIKNYLPKWVRHTFMKTVSNSYIYNRSAAFNHGAKCANGSLLLLHDNDMLVHQTYCQNIVSLANRGYDAINTKRYIFYLNSSHTDRVLDSLENMTSEAPEYIVQNLEAGGSMAISKEAFFRIGGMDEEFVGWGGEDIEFWRRCSLLKRWIWGYEPLIHLWHLSQPLKKAKENPNITRLKYLDSVDLIERVESLREQYRSN